MTYSSLCCALYCEAERVFWIGDAIRPIADPIAFSDDDWGGREIGQPIFADFLKIFVVVVDLFKSEWFLFLDECCGGGEILESDIGTTEDEDDDVIGGVI
jgi:hypothetical protein